MSVNDDELDAKIRKGLHRELDGQLGRATRHFRQNLEAQAHHPAAVRLRLRWMARLSAVAAAACLVLVVGRYAGRNNSQVPLDRQSANRAPTAPQSSVNLAVDKDTPSGAGLEEPVASSDTADTRALASAAQPLLVARALRTRTLDEGTLMLDGRAVRKIRRQWFERVEWFDPRYGARLQKIVPREQVVFLPLSIN